MGEWEVTSGCDVISSGDVTQNAAFWLVVGVKKWVELNQTYTQKTIILKSTIVTQKKTLNPIWIPSVIFTNIADLTHLPVVCGVLPDPFEGGSVTRVFWREGVVWGYVFKHIPTLKIGLMVVHVHVHVHVHAHMYTYIENVPSRFYIPITAQGV